MRETCAEWELADLLTNDAVQVASELVQNTVQHTFSEVALLRLELGRDRLTVAVGDGSAVPVVLGDPGSAADFGRGLHVVAQLARTWGCVVDRTGGTKTVRAVLWTTTAGSALPQDTSVDAGGGVRRSRRTTNPRNPR